MNNISRLLLILALLIIIIALVYDWNFSRSSVVSSSSKDQTSIRNYMASKGLPTPAFADLEELKKILKETS